MSTKKKLVVLPVGTREVPVSLQGSGEKVTSGTAHVKEWSAAERQSRALKRTAKIVGGVFAGSLIGLFVHILLLVIIPLLLVTIAGALPLYLRFMSEDSTWFRIDGNCPNCGASSQLRPFIDTRFLKEGEMSAQCPECGQNARFQLRVSQ